MPVITVILLAFALQDFELTDDSLTKLSDEAWLVVSDAYAPEGMAKPTIRIVDADDARKSLIDDLRLQRPEKDATEEQWESQVMATSRLLANFLLGKYALSSEEIFMLPENIERLSSLLEIPELGARETLGAVLVHEMIHAIDDHRFDLVKRLESFETTDQLQAFGAVMEGHAQWMSRRLCEELGWSVGFDTFTKSIGATPPTDDASLEFMYELTASLMSVSYYEGESFVAAILGQAKDAEERRARRDSLFNQPPDELLLIHSPQWYLDPSTRPRYEYDLLAALESLKSAYDERWMSNLVSLDPSQAKIAFKLLPAEQVDQVLAKMMQYHVLAFTERERPGDKQVAFGAYSFESAADALSYLALSKALLLARDESMKEGVIRITKAEYEDLEDEGWQGIIGKKVVAVGPQEVDALTVIACRGPLVIELLYSNAEYDMETVHRLRRQIFDRAQMEKNGPEGQGDEKQKASSGGK